MKFSKAIFVLVSGLSLAGVAAAEDQPAAVTAEKAAPIKSILPGAYGNVEVRHSTLRLVDTDGKKVNDIPALSVRPTLGTTLFDDKVDTAFTWVFKKAPDTNKITKSYLVNITQWKVLDGAIGNIGPYSEVYQANGASFNDALIGLSGELNKDFALPGATIALNGYWNPVAEYMDGHTNGGKDNQVATRNETSQEKLFLTGSTDDADANKVQQRDPNLLNQYGASAKYKPEAVKGLSLGLGSDIINKFHPKYTTKETASGEPRTEQDGYATSGLSITKIMVGYKLSDKVSLTGQFRQYTGGTYAKAIDSSHPDASGFLGGRDARFETRLQMVATLF